MVRLGRRLWLPVILLLCCICSSVFYDVRWSRDLPGRVSSTSAVISDDPEERRWMKCHRKVSTTEGVHKKLQKTAGGFMMVLDYWEKQAKATRSLIQLQCLATRMGLRTAEPFVAQSSPFLGLGFAGSSLPLGELVDVDLWNKDTEENNGFLPLVRWNEFLRNAPSNVIIVCMRYRNSPHVRTPLPGFDYRTGCPDECFDKFNRTITLLRKYSQFKVIRKACANFAGYSGAVGEASFIENILYHQDYRNVTVILSEFRGLYGIYRTDILSSCGVDYHSVRQTFLPSQGIMNYAQKFIREKFDNKTFIAVLASTEEGIQNQFSKCVLALSSLLMNLTRVYRVEHKFLATDVTDRKHSKPNTVKLLNAVYGGGVSYKQWEKTFNSYTPSISVTQSYVANLQRAIAARARCLVVFGGGPFVDQGQVIFERVHHDNGCIHRVCYTPS